MTSTPRKCAATTKKGTPCKVTPQTGGEFCLAHSPKEAQEAAGFGGAQENAGRPPLPKVTDVLREKVEAEADLILKPYFDTLRDAVLTASYEGEVIASDIEDLGAKVAVAEKLLDRVYGKPKQSQEISGPDGGPIDMSAASDQELRALRDQLAAKRTTS